MKTLMVTVFAFAALTATLSACALDPAGEEPKTEVQSNVQPSLKLEFSAAALEDAMAKQTLSASSAEDAANLTANCSIVQFCNAPGSDGTRCVQQGCSVQAAFDECVTETFNVCGAPSCPWKLVLLNGTSGTITPCP